VSALDVARCEIGLAGGRVLPFEKLLLATGGVARRLTIPGAELPGAVTLRTMNDAVALAPRLVPDTCVLVVGGRFIGLEVAAAARQRGCRVILVEAADQLMGRAVPRAIGERALCLHRERGIDMRLQTAATEIIQADKVTLGISLTDGSELSVSTIVVDVGIEPAAGLARPAGLAVNRGIVVDGQLSTSAPVIFSAGDVTEFPSPLSGQIVRQESWYNAETQARTAARNMQAGGEVYAATPWLWSDLYEYMVEVAGEPSLGASTIIRTGSDAAEIHFHLGEDGSLAGASGFGPISVMAREFMLARKLERRYRPRAGELGDSAIALKSLLRSS
jgi:3-phenylpropionate/trans-cinnamate dioxygenase ferredoxin reductase subunit